MQSLESTRTGLFYGWWIVAACSLLTFYGAGTFFYGFTVFVQPMAMELGWGMALISGAFALFRLEAGIGAPLAGFLLDRMGPRLLVMGGGLLWGAGFIYLSHARTVLHFYVAFLVISLGWTFASGTAVPSALISKWFVRKRGRALGLFAAISGLSGLLVPGLAILIEIYGWQHTLWVMGLVTWLVILPVSFTLRHRPEDHGLLPDGIDRECASRDLEGAGSPGQGEADFSVRKALVTPAFWLLSLSTTIFQMTMSALFVHLVPHLLSANIEPRVASMAVTVVTVCSVMGRLGFGWLSDSVSKKWLLIFVFLLQGVGLYAFSQVQGVAGLIPFLVSYAPSYGGNIVLRAAITADYYGRRNFGTIYGVLVGMGTFGGIAGPIMAGFAYDRYGDYRSTFVLFALASILCAISLIWMRRPRAESFGLRP